MKKSKVSNSKLIIMVLDMPLFVLTFALSNSKHLIMNTIFNDIPERNINNIFYKTMNIVELLFGTKDSTFQFIGISLNEDAPCLYFPNGYETKKVEIRITSDCKYNLTKAVYQTSHECVHLLYPNPLGTSTYLEEGIATFFSLCYTNRNYGSIKISDKKYSLASDMAGEVLQSCPSLIKDLRAKEPNTAKITKDMLLDYFPALGETLADALATNFQSDLPMRAFSM